MYDCVPWNRCRGATAVVHRCEHKGTRKPWAVKTIEKKVRQQTLHVGGAHVNVTQYVMLIQVPYNLSFMVLFYYDKSTLKGGHDTVFYVK